MIGCPTEDRWTRIWCVRPVRARPPGASPARTARAPRTRSTPRVTPVGVHADLRPARPSGASTSKPVVGNGAAHQGQVRAPRLVTLEIVRSASNGVVVARHDEQPARPRVEAVDDPRTQRARRGAQRDPHAEQAVDDGPAPPVLGGVGRQPCSACGRRPGARPARRDSSGGPLGGEFRRRHQVDLDPLAARETVRQSRAVRRPGRPRPRSRAAPPPA